MPDRKQIIFDKEMAKIIPASVLKCRIIKFLLTNVSIRFSSKNKKLYVYGGHFPSSICDLVQAPKTLNGFV
jgi:hypothetical protein